MFEHLLQKKINSAAKALAEKERTFLNFHSIERVLIFFDIQDWSSVVRIIDDLKQNNKEIILWTIGNDTHHFTEDVKYIDQRKDLNWNRVLKTEIVSEFRGLEYDTFLDLSLSDNMHMLLLKVKNTSRFAIGFKENMYNMYDFVLWKQEDNTLFEAYEQAKSYLINNI